MLVLSRKKEESIIIDEDVNIKILEVTQNHVKIGIDAPEDKKIIRKELARNNGK